MGILGLKVTFELPDALAAQVTRTYEKKDE